MQLRRNLLTENCRGILCHSEEVKRLKNLTKLLLVVLDSSLALAMTKWTYPRKVFIPKDKGHVGSTRKLVLQNPKILNKIPHIESVTISEVPPQLKNGSVTPVTGSKPTETAKLINV